MRQALHPTRKEGEKNEEIKGDRRPPRVAGDAPHLVEAVLAVGFRLYLHLHHHRVRPGHIAQHGWGRPAPPPRADRAAAAVTGGEGRLWLRAAPRPLRPFSATTLRLTTLRCRRSLLIYPLRPPLRGTCGPIARRRSPLRAAPPPISAAVLGRTAAADLGVRGWAVGRPLPAWGCGEEGRDVDGENAGRV